MPSTSQLAPSWKFVETRKLGLARDSVHSPPMTFYANFLDPQLHMLVAQLTHQIRPSRLVDPSSEARNFNNVQLCERGSRNTGIIAFYIIIVKHLRLG